MAGRKANVGKATQIAVMGTASVMALMGLIGQPAVAEEASTYVALKLEGDCDAQNKRLWLANAHTFRTVMVTVRWRAAGGKDLTEQFYPGPNSIREIGCAAEAEILSSAFADF